MLLNELLARSYNMVLSHRDQTKIVLLHPDSRYRSLVVAKLLNDDQLPVFYYALGPDDLNVQSFLNGVTHEIALQKPMFGRHLNMLSEEESNDWETLLNTFARDLAELSEEPFIFVLDEYDRSDTADDIQLFMEQLVSRLPAHCCIVLNSRTLPRLPWVSIAAKRAAILLEDEKIIRSDFYEIPKEGKHILEVYALGPGFVLLDGRPIDTWEGHLPRLLFFFALDRPVITRSEICQAFWPELDMDQAVNVFHVTKRRLHKALDMDVLVHEDGYYRINPELGIYYDVLDFVERLMAGRDESNPDRLLAWQKAADLYRGPFLQGHSDRWILSRRQDFLAGYVEALTAMAQDRLAKDRPENALALFQKALAEDNSREDIHREVMRLFRMLGRRSEAAAHYQRLVEARRIQGQEPDTATQQLYDEIMA